MEETFKVFDNLCQKIQNQLAEKVDLADSYRKQIIDKVAVVQTFLD